MSKSPDYYANLAVQPLEVADAWDLSVRLAYAVKYICRRGNKPGGNTIEDLKKAKNCIALEIKRIESQS